MATSQGFCKMQIAMPSITETKRKHRKKESYIPVSFRIPAMSGTTLPHIVDCGMMDGKYYR